MNTYPERLPALLNIGVHAAQSRFEYIMCKGLVDEFGDAGLSIELYGWSEVATYFWPTTDLAVF